MNTRPFRFLTAAAALLVPLLFAEAASAQRVYVVREYDGPRFRGGINLEGGALIVPGLVSLGSIGLQGQLGVQINDQWGVYAIPSFDVLFGKLGGIALGFGALVDWTPPGVPISIGAGPEAGWAGALNTCDPNLGCAVNGFGGVFYGGRLHFAYYPVIVRYPYRRRALAIGADFRFLAGDFGTVMPGVVKVTDIGISPVVFIGYTAF
jgi:hypothetical protein